MGAATTQACIWSKKTDMWSLKIAFGNRKKENGETWTSRWQLLLRMAHLGVGAVTKVVEDERVYQANVACNLQIQSKF